VAQIIFWVALDTSAFSSISIREVTAITMVGEYHQSSARWFGWLSDIQYRQSLRGAEIRTFPDEYERLFRCHRTNAITDSESAPELWSVVQNRTTAEYHSSDERYNRRRPLRYPQWRVDDWWQHRARSWWQHRTRSDLAIRTSGPLGSVFDHW